MIGLFVAYAVLLFLGTLFPFNFRLDARAIAMDHLPTEWIPFTYWNARCGWPGYFKDKLFNVCIFIPFGVLLGLIVSGGPTPGKPLLKTTAAAALCSLTIEASQYFLAERHSTASDLLMNTVGGFLGAWLVVRGIQARSLNFGRTS
jgi:glycopeptide antibiotics resistance protein